MNKVKFVVVAMLVSLFAISGVKAQNTFKKSDKIVEGTVSYSKSTGSDAEYSFSPAVGYFVTDKIAVGLAAELGKSSNGDVTNFGAYTRCYFLNIGQNFKAYSQLGLASNTTKVEGVSASEFVAGVGLGANYFVSKKVALTAHIADLVSYENEDGNSYFNLGFTGFNNPFAMGKFGILIKL